MILGDFLKNSILLLGGSGILGKAIISSKLFKNLKYPKSYELNILSKKKLETFIIRHKINLILHCAAYARVSRCERYKKKAYNINVTGTRNIIDAIIKCSKKINQKIKIVYISTDGVYPSQNGNYKENSKLKPYNYYGFTKLEGEKIVQKLRDYIIIRTRFFNKKKIKFKYSALNIYNSGLEVNILVKYLHKIIKKNFKGIINVGQPKISDYQNFKKYKKNLIPCDKSKIFKEINFKIATDASLNLTKMNKLLKNNKKYIN